MKVVALIPAALLATSLTGCVVAPLGPATMLAGRGLRCANLLHPRSRLPLGLLLPLQLGLASPAARGGIAVGAERA